MTAHASIDAAETDAPIEAPRRWTVAEAITESSPIALVGAFVVAVALVLLAVGTDVAWPTAVVAIALVPAVLVDIIDRRLPDRMIATAAVVGASAMVIDVATGGDVRLAAASLGAGLMAAPLLVANLISPASMGFGDVKFAAVLGAALGVLDPTAALFALAIGSLVGSIQGLALRRRSIAFGPALLLGAGSVLAAHGTGLLVFT